VNSDHEAGFGIYPDVLNAGECDGLLALLEPLVMRSRAGARHLMSTQAEVYRVAEDPRLRALASAFVGLDAQPYRATYFAKSPASNWLVPWHQDTALPLQSRFDAPDWGAWSEKEGILYAHAPAWALEKVIALRIHLDDSFEDNGPLQVIPGSHRFGLLTDDEARQIASDATAKLCTVRRGGVIAMRPLLLHASSKCLSGRSRRVLHIEYAPSLELAPGIRLRVA
jgi:hypothetical protein